MKIAILALQGAFAEHERCLEKLGVSFMEIRKAEDMQNHSFDGLILPGGESTVMGKLLHDLKLFEPLQNMIKGGLPVFGTCAGLLLLAKSIENREGKMEDSHFACMDIVAKRNAYGRQLGSFSVVGEMKGVGQIPMVFIRAPYMMAVGEGVTPLAEVKEKIVAAQEGNLLVTAFHPELTTDLSVHEYFLNMIEQ